MTADHMGDQIPVLDHGYVRLIEHWGSDERIIEAARMSTGKGFQGWSEPRYLRCSKCDYTYEPEDRQSTSLEMLQKHIDFACPNCETVDHMELIEPPRGDEKLLEYLYTHQHNTPFEMAGMVIEVQAPIFVFREWHRHRTQSYNELSARYTPIPDVNYMPTIERIATQDQKNKQAAAVAHLKSQGPEWFQKVLGDLYVAAQQVYEAALDSGIPKELARLVIPVGRYSRMRASANLRNWLAFMTLRCAPNAQLEIRQYANAVATIIGDLFPRTYTLWDDYDIQMVKVAPGTKFS